MDKKEKEIMELLVKAHNIYVGLNQTHPSDNKDWCDNFHRLQDILSRRIVRRDYPNEFITIEKEKSICSQQKTI